MASLSEKLYALSPVPLQDALVTMYGRKLQKQRYGAAYTAAFEHYATKDYSDAAAEREVQRTELLRLLRHARERSGFYRRLWAGIDVDAIRGVEDLHRLPPVDKEDLRTNIDSVRTLPLDEGIPAFTGGTTGKSLEIVYTRDDFQRRMAYLDAFKVRCGIDPHGARKATFSGRSFAHGIFQPRDGRFWRTNRAYNQRLYSTFDLREENLPAYVEDLNRYRPDVVNGFVSALHQLAAWILDHGVRLDFRPRAMFTTSETLLPFHRETIERAFGAPVYDQYASAEGAPFITECTHRRLHYNIDTGVIEVVDLGAGPEMLVTSFTTYGTPLVRYRIGDSVRMGEGTCPCGSSHPLVDRIEGRAVDYLYSPERGRVALTHLADVIKGLPNCVREMQFVQDEPRSVTVRMAVDPATYTPEADVKIRESMRYRFGEGMAVCIERVERIPREASGKFRLVRNSLRPEDVRGDAAHGPDAPVAG